MTKKHVKQMLSKVPRGRFLELNELSSMVCWLSSEENSFQLLLSLILVVVDPLINFLKKY